MIQINVKERIEALTSEMTAPQQAAIRMLASDLEQLNETTTHCVESGLTVELQRTARHHTDDGYWGDILVPKVVKQRRYIVAFDDLDPGSEIDRNLAKARDIRSAYYRELMLRLWACLGRWLGSHVPRKTPDEIPVGRRHQAGS